MTNPLSVDFPAAPTIGFIGLGLMGHGMAKNLRLKGYDLWVKGRSNRTPVESLLALGAQEATSPKQMAEVCDIIHICLSNSPQIEAAMRGPDGILAGARPGLIVIETSTANPASTEALAAELAANGVTLVDAPLSRTPKEAWEGTLDTMVGADPEVFARIRPILETWAGKIVHIGRVGDGSHPEDGIYVMLKEVLDNSVDEFIMGEGKRVEIARDGTVVRTWRSWEHLSFDEDRICPLESHKEWTHANSIETLPDGRWLVTSQGTGGRGLDAVAFGSVASINPFTVT